MKKLIIYLIRRKLGLKKHENFRFCNQKSPTTYYYFTDEMLVKNTGRREYASGVPFNWLIDEQCKIKKVTV